MGEMDVVGRAVVEAKETVTKIEDVVMAAAVMEATRTRTGVSNETTAMTSEEIEVATQRDKCATIVMIETEMTTIGEEEIETTTLTSDKI